MRITFQWEDAERTLLLLRLTDGWTWVEYHAVVSQLVVSIQQLDYAVDVIVENTARIPFPSGKALSHLRRIMRMVPDNIGVIVIVSANPFVKTINHILFRVMPKTREIGELADTVEEAHAIITRRRAQRRNDSGAE